VVAVAAWIPISCSFFVDGAGLTGGSGERDAAAEHDAAEHDATEADATEADATEADATEHDAAEHDAADGGSEGSPPDPCESTHAFCDSFDQSPLEAKWTEVVTEAGTVEVSAGEHVSAPNSLLVEVAASAPEYSSSAVFKMLSSAAHHHVEASVLVPSKPAGSIDFVSLDFQPPPPGFLEYSVAFGVANGTYMLMRWTVDTNNVNETGHWDLSSATSFAVWRRVGIDVTLSPGGSVAVLLIDGQEAGQLSLPPSPAVGLRVGVGAPLVAGMDAPCTIWVDDVVVDQS
jgi:hypothetical protein